MKTAEYRTISEDDYLVLEARSPVRHEYVCGEVYAMTGASLRHNVIAGNLFALLRAHLRGTPCRAFVSDAKLRIAKAGAYYYPDVMVTCDPRHLTVGSDDLVVEAPKLIVEVLSTSTEGIDRREKLTAYRGIPSLVEYVLVAQDEAKIEIHRRQGDIGWEIVTLTPGDPVELKSLEFTSDFPAIYEETGLVPGGVVG
ncbi:MAG: Uma2 family endonuclease [Azospira sp.]|nr:Uma2 family endonuclease [Azospira sp.]